MAAAGDRPFILIDGDEEPLLQHFCIPKERTDLVKWCADTGVERADTVEQRVATAMKLKESGNTAFKVGSIRC
jgi:hypothetical protein